MRYRDKVQKIRTDLDALVPDEYTIIPADPDRKQAATLAEYREDYRKWKERTAQADYRIPMTPPDDLPSDFFLTGVKQI